MISANDNLTQDPASVFLDAYRRFRDTHPLPDGWTEATSVQEASDGTVEPSMTFSDGVRGVTVELGFAPLASVGFSGGSGDDFTAAEVDDLLRRLVGVYDTEAEVTRLRAGFGTFPGPGCDLLWIDPDQFFCAVPERDAQPTADLASEPNPTA